MVYSRISSQSLCRTSSTWTFPGLADAGLTCLPSFVTLHIRFYKLWRNQLHRVTPSLQLSTPVMWARTGLHTNLTTRLRFIQQHLHPLMTFQTSLQRMSLELRAVTLIFLLCHGTPPYALLRTFKGVHQTGAELVSRPQTNPLVAAQWRLVRVLDTPTGTFLDQDQRNPCRCARN